MSNKRFTASHVLLVSIVVSCLVVGMVGVAVAGAFATGLVSQQARGWMNGAPAIWSANLGLPARLDGQVPQLVAPKRPKAAVDLAPKATEPEAPAAVSIGSDSEDQLLESLYEAVNPSVVGILVSTKVQQNSVMPNMPGFNLPNIPGFELPFQLPQGQAPQERQAQPRDFVQRGEGSGFVFDKEGRIVTNNHVVENANTIRVIFFDDASVPAKVVARDPDSDLAVIKVDPKGLKLVPLALGDSSALKVGQRVIAIGNPFGLKNSMTTGIVSALGRSLPTDSPAAGVTGYTIPNIVQTDAAINPGNSGGPLLNAKGEVVGVNSAIESPVRAFSGVGFAIPSAIVKIVVPKLIEDGSFDHAWLGISGTTLNPQINQKMDLPADQRGVLVVDVTKSSPAAKAGLKASQDDVTIDGDQMKVGGDVIVGINDQPVHKFEDLLTYLAYHAEANGRVTLTVLRGDKSENVTVKLSARPAPADRQPVAEQPNNNDNSN